MVGFEDRALLCPGIAGADRSAPQAKQGTTGRETPRGQARTAGRYLGGNRRGVKWKAARGVRRGLGGGSMQNRVRLWIAPRVEERTLDLTWTTLGRSRYLNTSCARVLFRPEAKSELFQDHRLLGELSKTFGPMRGRQRDRQSENWRLDQTREQKTSWRTFG
jgi:hypothetical protein